VKSLFIAAAICALGFTNSHAAVVDQSNDGATLDADRKTLQEACLGIKSAEKRAACLDAMTRVYVLVVASRANAAVATIVKPEVASIGNRQLAACGDDIKLGLSDPNSFEVLSAQTNTSTDGRVYLAVKYTAKNKFGGRVRGEASCGFRDDMTAELDIDDARNKDRNAIRRINEALGR
jgi:hypothetical protein